MRSVNLLFLIVLHALTATAAEVIVKEPVAKLAPTLQHLRELCPGPGDYDACTRFVAYRLEAACTPAAEAGWSMRTTATFTPWVFLYSVKSMTHELDHVSDVRATVHDRLSELEALQFASQADCTARGIAEENAFEGMIREAVALSNAKRHPLLYGHPRAASFTNR